MIGPLQDTLRAPAPDGARVADGLYHPLDPRVITARRIASWIMAGALAVTLLAGIAFALLIGAVSEAGLLTLLPMWLAIAAGSLGLAHALPLWQYRCSAWRLTPGGLEIRHGVVWKSVISLPRDRVQHTDVSQGPLDRNFGIATLIVHTAGSHHAMVALAGLEHGTALRIRDYLIREGGGDGG